MVLGGSDCGSNFQEQTTIMRKLNECREFETGENTVDRIAKS
jgi:hypothetical protein